MIHTAKGLLSILGNTPVTITNNAITRWSLGDASIIQTVNYTFKEDLNNYDVRQKDGRIFITDLQNADLYYIEDDLSIQKIVFGDRYEDRKVPNTYLFKNLNSEDLIIDTRDSYGYYLLNLKSSKLIKYSSILVLKNTPSLSRVYNFFIGHYNTLYMTNDSEMILYHEFDHDETKSEIGIYLSAEEKMITQFEAPEPIDRVNFYNNLIDKYNTGAYSNVKGCLVGDKIILCYQHMLYVLDYNGNIIKARPATENSRYWGVEKLNDNQVLLSELDPTDSEKMFVFDYSID
ncbi:hypothetical protein [Chryseobacterium sediminis]|uniref:hypothetical protein n=1 Tax=Chryseobacterium sediminis TaxID=1679494 RepID=UPI0028584EA6|nr:hypothetical protein [Chryseobacterium sediminis]MDR6464752.1 hypothetical protein [Chryseobacterium sediminis]